MTIFVVCAKTRNGDLVPLDFYSSSEKAQAKITEILKHYNANNVMEEMGFVQLIVDPQEVK